MRRALGSLAVVLLLLPACDGELGTGADAGPVDAPGADVDRSPDAVLTPDGPRSDRPQPADRTPGPDAADGGTPTDATPGPDTVSPEARRVVYVSGYAPQIAWFELDAVQGTLSGGNTLETSGSPSFLALGRGPGARRLYAIDEASSGRVTAFDLDAQSGAPAYLNEASTEGAGPAHVALDGTGGFVLVSHYTDGTVSVLPAGPGGVGPVQQHFFVGDNAHQMIADPSNRFVFVPCKGDDLIGELTFDAATGNLAASDTLSTGAGSGPRHLDFHPSGRWAYGLAENSSTLTAYALDGSTGLLSPIGPGLSTLPDDFAGQNTGAEVAVHPAGRWVLASNRGHDSVAVFAIDETTGAVTAVGHGPAGGSTPRSFAIDPGGRWVLVANQGSSNVVVLDFDAATGSLTASGVEVSVPSPAFVGVAVF